MDLFPNDLVAAEWAARYHEGPGLIPNQGSVWISEVTALQGHLAHKKQPPPQDPTVGPCLGPYGGPGEGVSFL